jgi:hypothetical protein
MTTATAPSSAVLSVNPAICPRRPARARGPPTPDARRARPRGYPHPVLHPYDVERRHLPSFAGSTGPVAAATRGTGESGHVRCQREMRRAPWRVDQARRKRPGPFLVPAVSITRQCSARSPDSYNALAREEVAVLFSRCSRSPARETDHPPPEAPCHRGGRARARGPDLFQRQPHHSKFPQVILSSGYRPKAPTTSKEHLT